MIRSLLFACLIASSASASLTACSTNASDGTDQLDAPGGKEDAASKPGGAYTTAQPAPGDFTTLSLNDDHTFTRASLVECAFDPSDCPPITEKGKYLFTHSTTSTKKYIRFYSEDGTPLDRYVWRLTSTGDLKLELDGDTHWFTMAHGSTCQAAGGNCVPLVPDACEFGSIGDANEYSCGGGLGVECCLPPMAPQCSAASDCTGLLPQFCNTCSDGTTACAHWSCVEGACQIASCN